MIYDSNSWMSVVVPISVGLVAGLCYGYLMALQQRVWFGVLRWGLFLSRVGTVFFIAVRIGILWITAYYLLRQASIPSILGAVAFLATFLFSVLRIRVSLHERIWHRRD